MNADKIIALDEVSLIHSIQLQIPPAFKAFFDTEVVSHRNFSNLSSLTDSHRKGDIKLHRFDPLENVERNTIKFANELLSKRGNQTIMFATLRAQLLDQLLEQLENLQVDLIPITKSEDIVEIKSIFSTNERELKKQRNIPEDDDFSCLAGFSKLEFNGTKIIVSEDEHFWGYGDLILEHWNIQVVPEWECGKIRP